MAEISFPRWLENSGLPEELNREASPCGYFVFKKLVELDLYQNVTPDIVKTSLFELKTILGLSKKEVEDHLKILEKKKYIRIFWGTVPEEEIFLRICIPVKTTIPPSEIPVAQGGCKGKAAEQLLYYDETDFDRDEDNRDREEYFQSKLEHVTNWYMRYIKPDLNPIVLQKIHYLCKSFSYQDLQQAFQNAKKNKVRSLECLMRELYSYKKP